MKAFESIESQRESKSGYYSMIYHSSAVPQYRSVVSKFNEITTNKNIIKEVRFVYDNFKFLKKRILFK